MAISTERIIDNKFLLVTIVVSLAAWVIAFGGLCALGFLGSVWWVNIFELLLIASISYVFVTDAFYHHRLAILALLALSTGYLTLDLNTFIGLSNHASGAGAVAAGYVILVIIQIVWIVVFGSEPNTVPGQLIHTSNSIQQQPVHHAPVNVAPVAVPVGAQPVEMTSDKVAYEDATGQAGPQAASPVLEYKERVEALHDYQANPEDPNELSFARGEIVEIVDRRGNWWQARKTSDGSVGIVPSNYFS
ncbi:hypothetical protein BC940DRAFT_294303 [Gongronella butleri]|nr:hypothetical protein BC940DRAFT_294303 [Gongronella butleri]